MQQEILFGDVWRVREGSKMLEPLQGGVFGHARAGSGCTLGMKFGSAHVHPDHALQSQLHIRA